jgi:ubiquinone biosynthesis O-methyltransferase
MSGFRPPPPALITKMLRVLGRGAVRRRALSTSSRPEEVRKFSRIGSEWWNPSSRAGAAPLHGFNFARVQHIGKALGSRRLAGVKALDVGCGGGLLSESLARLGCNVRGIDLSEESIAVATAHAAGDPLTRGIQYETRSLEEIVRGAAAGEREGGYDLVCASEVIEHVDSPREFLGALCELVRPGGHLTVSTINRTPQVRSTEFPVRRESSSAHPCPVTTSAYIYKTL